MKKKGAEQQRSLFDKSITMEQQVHKFKEMEQEFPPHGAVHRSDPQTSKVAAALVDAGGLEMLFLRTLFEHGNRSTEEVAEFTGKTIPTISPRTAPLKRKKLIVDAGERKAGASGVLRIVWVLTPLGREVVIRNKVH